MTIVDKLALFKIERVKDNSQEWFDGEVWETIALRDKLFWKFKLSKLKQIKKFMIKHAASHISWFWQKKRVLQNQVNRKYC